MRTIIIAALLTALVPAAVVAQAAPAAPTIPAEEAGAIPLDTGGVPGGAKAEEWLTLGPQTVLVNVTRATLTPVLPAAGKANGAAVVVAPGGGFTMLSMQSEGYAVARRLAARGVAAFVLKYRLRPQTGGQAGLDKAVAEAMRAPPGAWAAGTPLEAPAYAIEDGIAALRLVRARAAEWGVDPSRVGMLGFSAGARTVLETTIQSGPDLMPSFVAPIYGSIGAVAVPRFAPPLFVAAASDDPLFARGGFKLAESWLAAGRPAEVHIYQRGSHGFGVGAAGTTSADWIDSFLNWLDMNGFLQGGQ